MGYLGNTPGESFISFAKQVFTIVNSQTAYTLDFAVVDENELRLVVNNVVQEPGSGKAYTASGTTLTLSAALTNGTDEMYCVFLGKARETVTVPTITKDKLNLISTSSSAGLEVKGDGTTDGTLQLNCSQNSHGIKLASPPHSAGQSYTLTFPQSISADTFLKTDGSGNLSFASAGGTNTPSFSAVVSSDTSLGTSKTLVPFDVELHDSDDCYTNTSGNYKFTPNVAGKYFIGANMYGFGLQDQNQVFWSLHFNGSQATYNANWVSSSASNRAIGSFVGAVLEFNGSSDYVQAYVESGSNAFTIDNGSYASTSVYTKQLSASNFFGYKLIGV